MITSVPHAPWKCDLPPPLRVWERGSLPWIWAGFNEPLVSSRLWQKGHRVTADLVREDCSSPHSSSFSGNLEAMLHGEAMCVPQSPGPAEPGFGVIPSQVSGDKDALLE